MKRKFIYQICMILAMALIIPDRAFALLDIGMYSGYSFKNRLSVSSSDIKPSGGQFAILGHYTKKIRIVHLGAGGGYQHSFLNDGNLDYDRQNVFLDVSALLDIPILPFMPYLRAGTPIWDRVSGDRSSTDYFRSAHIGGGIEVGVPILPVNIFVEYVYTAGKQGGNTFTGNAVHAGIRFVL